MSIWWLSYAAKHKFRGVVIIEAPDFLTAAYRSNKLNLSPGGQVVGFDVSDEIIDKKFMRKLLSKEDIVELQGEAKSLGEIKKEHKRHAKRKKNKLS